MIKVPLGKGATQQLQQEEKGGINPPTGFPSDIEFIRNLLIKKRMVIENNFGFGTLHNIIPPPGSTFYFLKMVIVNTSTTTKTTIICTNNDPSRGVRVERFVLQAEEFKETNMPLNSIVGDGSASFTVSSSDSII